MIPAISGYTIKIISTANTPEELNSFVTQEASLPQFSRIIIEVPIDPDEDMPAIAQQIQTACAENYVPYWPEHQGAYTFIEGNTLYIAYMRPSDSVSPMMIGILPILLIIGLIAPIIMYFAIPGLSELVDSIVMIVVMMIMMKIMGPMFSSISGPKAEAAPRESTPPIEQRISRRIESIADSIVRTEAAFERSKSAGASAVTSVVSDIRGVARAIKGTPSTAMTGYQKSKAAERLDVLDDNLSKYEEHLTPGQLENLREERRIVDELRTMYD